VKLISKKARVLLKWKAVGVEMDGFGKYVDGGEEM
jgi:hypothetical protein